jgi:hypothetical protein
MKMYPIFPISKPLTEVELAASQEKYASRKYSVRWITSHYSGTHRFEAFNYVQVQWRQVQEAVAEDRYRSSCLHQSQISTPDGSISVYYYLLCNDVSSY